MAKWIGGVLQVANEFCLSCRRKGVMVSGYAYGCFAAADVLAYEHEWRPATSGAHPHELRRDAICAYRSADHFERRMANQASLERLLEGVRRIV